MTGSSDDGVDSDNSRNSDVDTRSQKKRPPDLSVWDWSGRGSHVDFLKDEVVPLKQLRCLGRGRNGPVYETECKGVTLAWKQRICRYKITQKELREIEILKKLNHKHVVMLVGTYTHLKFLGILLWPVAVCDLATLFDDLEMLHHPQSDLKENREAISERMEALKLQDYEDARVRILRFLGCLAGAVEYLHSKKIRHKDLKPMNILLSRDGLWLTDFDVSTDFSHLSYSSTDNGERGTLKYFAPEVARYEKNGRAADVFSLGCIFFEILTLGFGGCLEHLQSLRPMRCRSFQANLDSIDAWLSYIESVAEEEEHSFLNADQDPLGRMASRHRSVFRLEHSLIRNLVERMLSKDPRDRPISREITELLRVSAMVGRNQNRLKARFYGSCCASTTHRMKGECSEDDLVAQEDDHGDNPFANVFESGFSITDPDRIVEGNPIVHDPHPPRDRQMETREVATPTKRDPSRHGLSLNVNEMGRPSVQIRTNPYSEELRYPNSSKISKTRKESDGYDRDDGARVSVARSRSHHVVEASTNGHELDEPIYTTAQRLLEAEDDKIRRQVEGAHEWIRKTKAERQRGATAARDRGDVSRNERDAEVARERREVARSDDEAELAMDAARRGRDARAARERKEAPAKRGPTLLTSIASMMDLLERGERGDRAGRKTPKRKSGRRKSQPVHPIVSGSPR